MDKKNFLKLKPENLDHRAYGSDKLINIEWYRCYHCKW